MTLDKLFLSLHVFGAFIWIGGLFALAAFLDAFAAETDPAARSRLTKFVRQAAMQFKLFTQHEAPSEVMRNEMKRIIGAARG